MFKGQKGITLVALVITIIVLLILAGVSISLVVGQNGVLTQATGSVSANKAASAKQAVNLSLAALETKYYTKWVTDQTTARSSVYTTGALADELSKQGYTLSATDNGTAIETTVTTSLITSNTLYVKSGNDRFELKLTIGDDGKITYTKVSIYNKTAFEEVKNI